MTIGDVLAVLAAVCAAAATWAALLVFLTLAVPARVAAAQAALAGSPGPAAFRGLAIMVGGGVTAFALAQNANGLVKALALLILAGLGTLAAVGSAGIVKLIGERIAEYGPQMPPFAARTRAAVLYVLAGLVPVVGWFFVMPIALFSSVGAGMAALTPPAAKPAPVAASSPETALDARI